MTSDLEENLKIEISKKEIEKACRKISKLSDGLHKGIIVAQVSDEGQINVKLFDQNNLPQNLERVIFQQKQKSQ